MIYSEEYLFEDQLLPYVHSLTIYKQKKFYFKNSLIFTSIGNINIIKILFIKNCYVIKVCNIDELLLYYINKLKFKEND